MVKPGYKQTEIGVIPKEWQVTAIGDIASFQGGSQPDIKYFSNQPKENRIRLIQIRDYKTERYITYIPKGLARRFCTKEDIMIGRYGPPIFQILRGLEGAYNVALIKAIPKSVNREFLYYVLKDEKLFEYIELLSRRSSGQTGVDLEGLRNYLIGLPALEEQEYIAEALSDVDSMISSLEKLIEKKKAVKQGSMQELLTGKKRLSGFTGEWIEKKVEDVVIRFATGLNPRQNFKLNDGGMNYYVTIKDFKEGRLFLDDNCDRIDDVALARINERSDLRKNDLLFSSIGRIGDAYLITETPKNWNINESVFTLRPNLQLVNPLMLYYLLTSDSVKRKLTDSTTGSTLKSIKLGHLKTISCVFPKDLDEQVAIASILSDMDNEIEALEQKLAKTRQLKQGMMQQLLTGKIRLIDDENVFAGAVKHNDLTEVKTSHNHQFDDAVMIAAIVNAFYSEKYPLGRKKVQKLLYLLRRKQDVDTSEFKKKAAGPYADEVRYKGGEPIAKRNGYIATSTTSKGTSFSKGKKIDAALNYVQKWGMESDFDWLLSQFKYTSVNDLELYATIDMAICDLQNEGVEISVDTVKNLIGSNKEWKAKLKKNYFSDTDIARAIAMSKKLFS